MAFEKINGLGFVALGDGKDKQKTVQGFLTGFREGGKNQSNRLLMQDEKTHGTFEVFSATVLDRVLLNKDGTDIHGDYKGRLVKVAYLGVKGKGKKAYKNFDVFVDRRKSLKKSATVPF